MKYEAIFTKSTERTMNSKEVVKYHVEVSKKFDKTATETVKEQLLLLVQSVVPTKHHHDRSEEKNIHEILFPEYMRNGQCFEYKMVNNALPLCRLAEGQRQE